MLIFHEGLPGAGKTYEAVVKHLLPAVERGRSVFTNIDGMSDPSCLRACSEVLGIPLETVQTRIVFLDDEQVRAVWNHVKPNSLLILDEIQNYWPTSREKLSDGISEFVSKHRHLGIDIICIGQDLRDTHNLWKRRIDRKVKFQKLDALGAAKRYRWVAYKSVGELKFTKTTEGIETYQTRFFGTYMSVDNDEVSTAVYADKRAILWNSKLMRLAIGFCLVAGISAPWYLYRQFQPSTSSLIEHQKNEPVEIPKAATFKNGTVQTPVPTSISPASSSAVAPSTSSTERSPGRDLVEFMSTKYRARLCSVIISQQKTGIVVEFRDDALRVQDRLDLPVLIHLGWTVRIYGLGYAEIQKGARIIALTSWPLESFTQVSNEQNQEVAEKPIARDQTQKM